MKRHTELPQVEEVHLPDFLGMRPGYYILYLLVIAIVVAIFLVCFLPGILKGGRYVNFSSPLSHTGVEVDGTYLGGTPYQYFVESGEKEIVFTKGGVELQRVNVKIDHPVFLTWLFHRTLTIEADVLSLSDSQKREINRFNLEEIVRYSSITSFDAVTVYPPVFTNWAGDALALGLDDTTIQESFALAVNYITSVEMLEDAKEAQNLLGDVQLPLIQTTLQMATSLFESHEVQKIGLEADMPLISAKKITLKTDDFEQLGFSYPALSFVMGDTVAAQFPQTNMAGVQVNTEPFVLASTPVSQYQWALFIEDNPFWDKGNKEELIAQGLVDEYYLSGLTVSVVFATGKPIHNVSYQAAQAYCEYLSEKTGKEVFLPDQEMWSLAARSADQKSYTRSLTITDDDTSSPSALLGGVWEFTQSRYVPLSRVTDYKEISSLQVKYGLGNEVIVKGGSYLNAPSSITEHTVGVVDTTACADQIGFRIAWKE
ncbi:MAG: SUMF1/EgtB/PvdO family nonheme iron enzyme [Sphaerochaeta sp.]|nr:SUMF1/EgtB/PvdO family nonheme iron enzyme [Sphaerochaeta sp.]